MMNGSIKVIADFHIGDNRRRCETDAHLVLGGPDIQGVAPAFAKASARQAGRTILAAAF